MSRSMKEFEFEWRGIEFVATDVSYYPGSPGRMYMSNGDPGYPPDPADVDYSGIFLSCDTSYSLNLLEIAEKKYCDRLDEALYNAIVDYYNDAGEFYDEDF